MLASPCRTLPRPLLGVATLILLGAASGCSSGDRTVERVPAAGTNIPPTPSAAGAGHDIAGGMGSMNGAGKMGGMAKMTGDADHDFLRMMSDHHKGLIVLAHMTKERTDVGAARADASKLDAEQDKEIDMMQTMLEKDFKDPYAPKVMSEHQQMADELKAKSGKDYERTFYQDIIKHHQEAVTMIDDYLPKGKNAMLKGMAQTMKTDQQKEIQDFQQKVAKLGA